MNKKLLEEGDVIEITQGMKVYANVPKHFLYANQKGNFELDRGCVLINDDLKYLTGKYAVDHTSLDGGSPQDDYPSGHHVFCVSLENDTKIDFYQTGFFSAMIQDIQPIGKAVKKWVIE